MGRCRQSPCGRGRFRLPDVGPGASMVGPGGNGGCRLHLTDVSKSKQNHTFFFVEFTTLIRCIDIYS